MPDPKDNPIEAEAMTMARVPPSLEAGESMASTCLFCNDIRSFRRGIR